MKKLLTTIGIALLSITAMAQAPAFPGAEGNGRYVTGGRGGNIVHVTNLNDKGTGSLRAAVSGSSKKIVVFDVGGVIPLASDLKIGANTTILGQTAPYPGITLRYYTIRPGGNNIIIRFIRSRRGQEIDVNDGADAIWAKNLSGMILDHCSFSWSIDEIASFYDNNNFTMQWCTLGESLNNAGHDKGAHGYGGIWGGKLASFHHNMIVHVNNRAPRFNGARYCWTGYTSNSEYNTYKWANTLQAENVDFRNCVMFDWGAGGCYGGPGGGYINMENNYFKASPETSNKNRVTQISVANSTSSSDNKTYWDMTSRYYISGNYVYGYGANYDWKGVKYDSGVETINGEYYTRDSIYAYGTDVEHVNNSSGVPCVKIKLDKAVAPTGEVTTHSAENAYEKVLSYAGASFYRDDVDVRYANETKNQMSTYTGSVTKVKGRIDLVSDCDGYTEENFPTGTRETGFDSDNDGMPDVWETANGLNPNDASDAKTYTLDSKGYYTNLEVYANSLVENIMKSGNADAQTTVDEYYPTVTKAEGIDYTGKEVTRVENNGENTGENTGVTGDEGTITWTLGTNSIDITPTITNNIADYISTTSITMGSSLSLAGTKNVNGTTETLFKPAEQQATADESNALKFNVTPVSGSLFQPTNVSFVISRIGTDTGIFDASWVNNASGTTTLDTNIMPNRNGDDYGNYTEYTKTFTTTASSDVSSLVINLYNLYQGKQFGLANVVIKGKIVDPAGISGISADKDTRVEFFNLAGQRVSNTTNGVLIKKITYINGKTTTKKVVR